MEIVLSFPVIFRSTDTLDSKKERSKASSLSDDEPLYDQVASDEDYASIGTFYQFFLYFFT